MPSLPVLVHHPDCSTYPCKQECCTYGADVDPAERERMLRDGVAREDEFRIEMYEGEPWWRTNVGPNGCVFLRADRGCRLHGTPYKPRICVDAPADEEERDEMRDDAILPCHAEWRWARGS